MKTTTLVSLAVAALLASTTMASAQVGIGAGASGQGGASVTTPGGSAGANANVGANANANASAENYGSVISSINSGASASVDLSSVTATTEIRIVLLSSLQGNAADNASALDTALSANASAMTTLHSDIEANADVMAKVEAEGHDVDDVVAVSSNADGSLTLYVDDRA